MSLRDKWKQFATWVGQQSRPIKDVLPEEVTNWEQGELAAKAEEFKAGEKYGTLLGYIVASYWDAKLGLTGGPPPTPEHVNDTAGELGAGIKFLALGVVVVLLIKRIFF